jgi:dihydroorotate dehydrogenase
MILLGTDFGRCWDMSGVRGFFGEGYAYHRPLAVVGLTFRGSRFTSKTTTLFRRSGNMPLAADGITPLEFKPICIKVDIRAGCALNAVSLSGPGLEFLINTGRWQKRTIPWIFSFMSLEPKIDSRLQEVREAAKILKFHLGGFQSRFVFQQNFSCPNVKEVTHGVEEVIEEAEESSAIVAELLPDLPQVPKLSVNMPPVGAKRMASNKNCHGLCCSNTVKWGDLSHLIDWKQFFDKSGVSPLKELGGGGLSGKPLLPLVLDWIKQVRTEGVTKPIIGGGGILGPQDAIAVRKAGANAIAVGSMSMLRPWRMQRTINVANSIGPNGSL